MAELYDKINANRQVKQLRQPNLTRQRHRFKGPRESQKINLEMDQLRYDLLNYQRQINELEAEIKAFYNYVMTTTEIGDIGDLDFSILASLAGYLQVQTHVDVSDDAPIPVTETIWDGGEGGEEQDDGIFSGGEA